MSTLELLSWNVYVWRPLYPWTSRTGMTVCRILRSLGLLIPGICLENLYIRDIPYWKFSEKTGKENLVHVHPWGVTTAKMISGIFNSQTKNSLLNWNGALPSTYPRPAKYRVILLNTRLESERIFARLFSEVFDVNAVLFPGNLPGSTNLKPKVIT